MIKNYLILDKDNKAINCISWEEGIPFILQEGAETIVEYAGPFFPDWIYDNGELKDPNGETNSN